MKAEQQTASLDLCKRLAELGVEIDSYFSHIECCTFDLGAPQTNRKSEMLVLTSDTCLGEWYGSSRRIICPAPTVAELFSLPVDWTVESDGRKGYFVTVRIGAVSSMRHYPSHISALEDAMCDRLIWLLENNHITAEQLTGGQDDG